MSFCANCGSPLGAAQFCGNCGQPALKSATNPACTECRGKGCNFCAQGLPAPSVPSFAASGVPVASGDGAAVETVPTAVFAPPGGGGGGYNLGASTSRRDPWERFSWASLPQEYKNNWITIGYNQRSWDGVAPAPRATDCDFQQLSTAQQRAANLLGYSAQMWDNDIHPDPLPPLSYSGSGGSAAAAPLRGHGPRESPAGCKCLIS